MYITSILVSIGSSIICAGLVYILLEKKIRRERSSSAITEQVRAEIDRMIVDLNQTADRNIGLIEQRLKALSDMLKEADHRVSLLQKHSDDLNRSTDTYSRIRPAQVVKSHTAGGRQEDLFGGDTDVPSAGKSHLRTKEASRQGSDKSIDIRLKKTQGSQGSTAFEEAAVSAGEGEPRVPKRDRVISLHRQGFSPDIIASRVDSTVAEVELIISMTEGQL